MAPFHCEIDTIAGAGWRHTGDILEFAYSSLPESTVSLEIEGRGFMASVSAWSGRGEVLATVGGRLHSVISGAGLYFIPRGASLAALSTDENFALKLRCLRVIRGVFGGTATAKFDASRRRIVTESPEFQGDEEVFAIAGVKFRMRPEITDVVRFSGTVPESIGGEVHARVFVNGVEVAEVGITVNRVEGAIAVLSKTSPTLTTEDAAVAVESFGSYTTGARSAIVRNGVLARFNTPIPKRSRIAATVTAVDSVEVWFGENVLDIPAGETRFVRASYPVGADSVVLRARPDGAVAAFSDVLVFPEYVQTSIGETVVDRDAKVVRASYGASLYSAPETLVYEFSDANSVFKVTAEPDVATGTIAAKIPNGIGALDFKVRLLEVCETTQVLSETTETVPEAKAKVVGVVPVYSGFLDALSNFEPFTASLAILLGVLLLVVFGLYLRK